MNLRERRHRKIRAKLQGTAARPRFSVFRSTRHIYAQLIDDRRSRTLVSMSDLRSKKTQAIKKSKEDQNKTVRAKEIGKQLAAEAQKAGIREVVFDRGGYRYHGRVKALAEGAREGGLKF